MKLVMLDTNVVIDIFYQRKASIEKLKEFIDYHFAISHLVYMEFMAGTQVRQKADARKFLSEFIVKPYDEPAQKMSEKFASKYFTGRENKPMDLLIAAHAKSLNLPIINQQFKGFYIQGGQGFSLQKSIVVSNLRFNKSSILIHI